MAVIDEDEEFIRGCRRLLRQTVAVLAADAARQEKWLGIGTPDDFAEDFDTYWLSRRDFLALSDEARHLLDQIDHEMEQGNADTWTQPALRTDPVWARVRTLATQLLPLIPAD